MGKQNLNKYIVIAFAILAIGILVLGDVLMIGMGRGGGAKASGGYVTGYMEAEYRLESFKGIVKIFGPRNFSEMSQGISAMEGVKKVYESPDEILIMTEDETAPMEIYGMVDGRYGTVLRKAVLIPEGTGTINKTIEVNVSMPLEVYLKPTIGLDSTVIVIAEVAAQEGEVKYMQNSMIKSDRETITVTAKVLNVTETSYIYDVDFGNRTLIEGLEGNFSKEISNIVMVPGPTGKREEYVSWVGDGYIIVDGNMTDKSRITEDYGNVTFTSSTIRSAEKLDMEYASESFASKVLVVCEDRDYILPDNGRMIIEMRDIGQDITAVNLVLDAEISGNLVMDYVVTGYYPVYS